MKFRVIFVVNIILVRPQIEENIGFVSRCMQNMGAERLIIVDPQCQIGKKAKATAASGPIPLQNHHRYETWQEFNQAEPSGHRIAFTCRAGQFRPVNPFESSLQNLGGEISLIFGPENNGLSNEELLDCQQLCSLPIFGPVTSMNLSHAVMLALYIFAKHRKTATELKNDSAMPFPNSILKTWLETLGYDLSGKTTAYSVLRQLFQTARPTKKQLVILEKVLQQNIRKLRHEISN